jgi:hypothetical protein
MRARETVLTIGESIFGGQFLPGVGVSRESGEGHKEGREDDRRKIQTRQYFPVSSPVISESIDFIGFFVLALSLLNNGRTIVS